MDNYKNLIDDCMLRYLDEIDFDNNNLGEVVLLHLMNGDLDDIYTNKTLNRLDDEEKTKLLNSAGKYINLCFTEGDYQKFDKSVDSPIKDKNFKLTLVLDSYDFLIKIAHKNIEILEELSKFRENKLYNKYSVISTIRYKFDNDDLLIDCFTNFLKTEKLYNLFDDKKRSLLYLNPKGIMYDKDKVFSSLDIAIKIYNKANKKRLSVDDVKNDKELVDVIYDFINSKDYKFEDIIEKL